MVKKTSQTDMQDPKDHYDQPEINKHQKQPEPGLDSALEPPADHGEKSYQGSARLKGRKALITGGDSGIGRAIAIAFAREGADVAISYLPAEQSDAKKVASDIEDAGQRALLVPGDISKQEHCIDMVSKVASEFGGIDILVNNAGKQLYTENFKDITADQLQSTFAVNVFAMFWITQAAITHMPKGSAIINTTSIQSYQPSAGLLDYASTKGAITTFTKGLSQMLIDKGIRVNGIAPGPIWTPLQPTDGQPPKKLENFGENTPIGRAGQPAELAPAYVFLASQESSYITGEIIGVTGGRPIS